MSRTRSTPLLRYPATTQAGRLTMPAAHGVLHWAPHHDAGLRGRMALIAQWVADVHPSAAVIDVSVEVAALLRLLGVPVVVVAMPGERIDAPHDAGLPACRPHPGSVAAGPLRTPLAAAARGQDHLRRRHQPIRRPGPGPFRKSRSDYCADPARLRRLGPQPGHDRGLRRASSRISAGPLWVCRADRGVATRGRRSAPPTW